MLVKPLLGAYGIANVVSLSFNLNCSILAYLVFGVKTG